MSCGEVDRVLLRFIHLGINGVPPTYREMCLSLGLSPNSVNAARGRVLRLVRDGFLEDGGNRSRSVRLTDAGFKEIGVDPAAPGFRELVIWCPEFIKDEKWV